jgi:hypothetical protein
VLNTQGCYVNVKSGTNLNIDGNVILENNGQYSSSGEITINGNWVNNSGTGGFIGSTGSVIFKGSNQSISGSSATTFNNIKFLGTGIKTFNNASNISLSGDLIVGDSGISDVEVVNQLLYPVLISGDFKVNSGSIFTNNGAAFNVIGNMIINGVFNGKKDLLFSGNNTQIISGAAFSHIKSLNINKTGGLLLLDIPVTVDSLLLLNNGIIVSSSVNVLTINNSANITGGSDASYVSGPIKKLGNSVFTFPLGDKNLTTGAYHPFSITATTDINSSYVAQYFANNQMLSDSIDADSLESISNCEYWSFKQLSGTDSIIPSLGWNTNSCNVSDPDNLTIAYLDGNVWRSMGTGTITVNGGSGILGGVFHRLPPFPIGDIITIGLKKFKANAGPDKSICIGNFVTLTGSASGFHGIAHYYWAPGGQTTSSISVNPTVSTTYTLSVTESGTFPRTTTDNVLVTVNSLPTVSASPSVASIYTGATVAMTASGATTYTWLPNTNLNTNVGTNVNANPTISTTYTVTGTDVNGCQNFATSEITVNSNPVVINVFTNSESLCLGESTMITADGAVTYSWAPESGLSSNSGNIVLANPTSTTTYTVTGTDDLGNSSSATITLTVNSLPIITFSSHNTVGSCAGTTLTANGASTYSWTPIIGLNSSTGSTVIAYPKTGTTYTVIGTDVNGCSNTATTNLLVESTPFLVTLNTSICSGTSTTLHAGSNCTWSPANGLSSTTGSTVTASPTSTTTYTVTAGTNNCAQTRTVTVTVNTCGTDCNDCIPSFAPVPAKKYLLSAWAKQTVSSGSVITSYTSPKITVSCVASSYTISFIPQGPIIDGWQKIEGEFILPALASDINIKLESTLSGDCYFDDIRVFPFDGSMKCYVYNPVNMRLVAELDERNYATLYEYDEEGKLVRVKKETERGIMTIKENRNNTSK